MVKIIRMTTAPQALKRLLTGQMKFLKQSGYEVIMISGAGKEVADAVAAEECQHYAIPLHRDISLWNDLKSLFIAVKLFRKLKPAIVHTHTPKAGLIGMLAAKIAGVPIRIHTVAGLRFETMQGFKRKIMINAEIITYKAATNVWPNSPTMLDFIVNQKWVKRSKTHIIGKGSSNGINTEKYSLQMVDEACVNKVKEKIGYEPENIYLLLIARMVKDKGVVELIDVFKTIQEKYPNVRLLLVGAYEQGLDPLPNATLEEIEHNPSIIYVGRQDSVLEYYALGNYFIFPSHREGFPNVLLQAGAMKLPVICSDISGNIDLVKDGETGLLFSKGSRPDIFKKITYALEQPALMKEMAENQYKNVVENYSNTVIWKTIEFEYKNILYNKKIIH